jgi:DNA-binding response OmpR family regulator
MSKKVSPERIRKIIVVDDDEGVLEGFKAILENFGFYVKTSPNAEILHKLTKNNLPDLILLDVLLSGEDGRDICKILKAKEGIKKVPIIMVSAHPSAGKTMKDAGADDFLAKPFEMDDLLAKVEKHIKKP